jgi:hypothetical protein
MRVYGVWQREGTSSTMGEAVLDGWMDCRCGGRAVGVWDGVVHRAGGVEEFGMPWGFQFWVGLVVGWLVNLRRRSE